MDSPVDDVPNDNPPQNPPLVSTARVSLSSLQKNIATTQPVDDGAESWVITYIDVITLLLTMFVLLLALSSQDKTGFTELQDSLKGVVTRPDANREQHDREAIQRKMAAFTAQLKKKDQAEDISYHFEEGKLIVQLGERILFPTAEASLNSSGYSVLEELLPVLNGTRYAIVIEGHTDNVPISNRQYASNWELSAARAANVVRYLSTHGIEAGRLSAVGFADTKPIADNASAEGRARNRRVTFKVSYEK